MKKYRDLYEKENEFEYLCLCIYDIIKYCRDSYDVKYLLSFIFTDKFISYQDLSDENKKNIVNNFINFSLKSKNDLSQKDIKSIISYHDYPKILTFLDYIKSDDDIIQYFYDSSIEYYDIQTLMYMFFFDKYLSDYDNNKIQQIISTKFIKSCEIIYDGVIDLNVPLTEYTIPSDGVNYINQYLLKIDQ